jgi:hypothetical protein
MKKIKEDGMMGGGAPINNTGSTSTTAGLSGKADPTKMSGIDPLMKFKKKKKAVKEEKLDSTTAKSKTRFKKNAVPKPDEQTDPETEYTKYTESKTFEKFMEQCEIVIKGNLNEDVFDRLYKISNGRFPERVMFLDRTVTHIDPLTAKFIVNTFENADPQLQKMFREMMNRNILAFMNVLSTMRQKKDSKWQTKHV